MSKIDQRLLDDARRHVAFGADILSRQRNVIERLKRHGLDTEESERMLAQFERTQELFEEDLDRLERADG